MVEDDVGAPVSPTTGEGAFLGGRLSEGLGWGCSCSGAPGYGDAPGTGGMIEAVEELLADFWKLVMGGSPPWKERGMNSRIFR